MISVYFTTKHNIFHDGKISVEFSDIWFPTPDVQKKAMYLFQRISLKREETSSLKSSSKSLFLSVDPKLVLMLNFYPPLRVRPVIVESLMDCSWPIKFNSEARVESVFSELNEVLWELGIFDYKNQVIERRIAVMNGHYICSHHKYFKLYYILKE